MASNSDSALPARNGKLQVAETTVARTTQWSVNASLATKSEWGDSDGAGFTNRREGRKTADISTEGKYDSDDEQFDLFQEGDRAIVTLWMSNAGDLYWDFPCALCDNFSMVVNIDSEEVIGWTSDWNSDGVFHRPGEPGAAARTL